MRLGVIGTGTIATAAMRGIAGDRHQITVSRRSAANAQALARDFANVAVADNQTVLDESDVIFVALLAGDAPQILRALRFRPDQRVITLMTGITPDEVAALVAPARVEAQMLPFPAVANGGSPILVLGAPDLVRTLFGARNQVFALPDAAEMDAYLCAQALLSPVARMVADAAGWLGGRVTDGAQAEAFLRVLIASSLADLESNALIQALNTPGGYNQRLRLHIETSGISQALTEGLDALERGA